MATFYLLNSLYVGANFLAAGTLIDDAVDNVANIKASGGALAPSSNPVVAAAALIAQGMKLRGQSPDLLTDIMGANVDTVLGKASATILFGALTAAALTQTISPAGLLLPAGARLLGRTFRLATAFSGGAIATMVIDLGVAAGNAIASAVNVFTGAPAAQKGTDGADPFGLYDAAQLTAKFTSTTGNVNAATAGSVTIDAYYALLGT